MEATERITPRRVALVTGGGGGIGRAISRAFAEQGWTVAVADLSEAAARETIDLLGPETGSFPLAGDVCNRADARRWVAETMDRAGALQVLVNNAGIQHVAPVVEFDEDRWDQLLAVMLTGPFLLTRHALPPMLEAVWGRVVNIGSIHSLVASRYKSAYVAAKHGLLGLTKVAALETAGTGVTVNAVCPSYVRTALVERQVAAQAEAHGIPEAEVIEKIMLPACPLGRLLEPEEVAQAVLYLCSDAAAGMTGAALTLDGGWTSQ
jgi:3-hydroxybutyrate dehydrogenase